MAKLFFVLLLLKIFPLSTLVLQRTYGEGEFGYSDTHEMIPKLMPLNPYGLFKATF